MQCTNNQRRLGVVDFLLSGQGCTLFAELQENVVNFSDNPKSLRLSELRTNEEKISTIGALWDIWEKRLSNFSLAIYGDLEHRK